MNHRIERADSDPAKTPAVLERSMLTSSCSASPHLVAWIGSLETRGCFPFTSTRSRSTKIQATLRGSCSLWHESSSNAIKVHVIMESLSHRIAEVVFKDSLKTICRTLPMLAATPCSHDLRSSATRKHMLGCPSLNTCLCPQASFSLEGTNLLGRVVL